MLINDNQSQDQSEAIDILKDIINKKEQTANEALTNKQLIISDLQKRVDQLSTELLKKDQYIGHLEEKTHTDSAEERFCAVTYKKNAAHDFCLFEPPSSCCAGTPSSAASSTHRDESRVMCAGNDCDCCWPHQNYSGMLRQLHAGRRVAVLAEKGAARAAK